MKSLAMTLLAATAIGAFSIGSASAMPFNDVSAAALGESQVQNVRVVCDRYRRCYNTGRVYRSARPYAYAPRYSSEYYDGPHYAAPAYGYYGGPRVGIGIGPFGFDLR
jgi:hypothetical protein